MRWTQQQYNEWLAKRGGAVGAISPKKRESNPHSAVAGYKPRKPSYKGGLAVVVTIVTFRNRLVDSDNAGMGGCKALRDAIADSCGIDDGSERIRFEYAQAHTTGSEGVMVKIETL